MQNPFMIQTPDLVENYARGVEIGNAQQDRQKQQEAEAANQQLMQQYQQDMYDLYQNPNATGKDFGLLAVKYPQAAKSIQDTWATLNADKQATHLADMTEVYSALENGQPEYAISTLKEKAQAARNSGDEEQAKKCDVMVAKGEYDPNLLRTTTGAVLQAIKGSEYVDSLSKRPYVGEIAGAEAKTKKAEAYIKGTEAENAPTKVSLENQEKGANIKNVENQIEDRAVKNDIELRKTMLEEKKAAYAAAKDSEISLDNDSREFINTKAESASTKLNNANRAADLAARLDKYATKEGGGAYQSIEEMAASAGGFKDEETAIRAEAQRVMTPIAMANYKKFTDGATSDHDIETAMGGYPRPTDSPEVLASFLRGLDKMQRYDANLEKAMVGWTSNVGSLADAPRDFEYKGIPIPKGTSYSEFEQMYIDKLVGDGVKNPSGKKGAIPPALKGKSYAIGNW